MRVAWALCVLVVVTLGHGCVCVLERGRAVVWRHLVTAAVPCVPVCARARAGCGTLALRCSLKAKKVYNLTQGMLSRGVPIHGVGLQMHVSVDGFPSPADVAKVHPRLRGCMWVCRVRPLRVWS